MLPEDQAVLNEIQRCNIQLLQLTEQWNFHAIPPGISITEMYDGLHQTQYGGRLMETGMRDYLNKNKPQYSSSPNSFPLARILFCPVPLTSTKF